MMFKIALKDFDFLINLKLVSRIKYESKINKLTIFYDGGYCDVFADFEQDAYKLLEGQLVNDK